MKYIRPGSETLLAPHCQLKRRNAMKLWLYGVSLILFAVAATSTFSGCAYLNQPVPQESSRPPVLEDQMGGP